MPSVWDQPVASHLQLTATPTGWGWFTMRRFSEMNNLIGIALRASCSIPPLLAVTPLFFKRRNFSHVGICLLQVGVLLLAASGVLSVGH